MPNQVVDDMYYLSVEYGSILRFKKSNSGRIIGRLEEIISISAHKQRLKALVLRALMHKEGISGEVNHREAIRLLCQAVELNDDNARFHLALIYEEGRGGVMDESVIIALYESAIACGDTRAMVQRAIIHINKQQYRSAIDLLDLATVCGNTRSMVIRALMHKEGLGDEVNIDAAVKLLNTSIQLGNVTALYNRAQTHEEAGEYLLAVGLYDRVIQVDDRLLQLQEVTDGYLNQFDEIKMLDEDSDLFAKYPRSGFFTIQSCSTPEFINMPLMPHLPPG